MSRIAAVLISLLALGLVAFIAPAAMAETLPLDPAIVTEQSVEQSLLDATNADRAANGEPALDFDSDSLAIARQRAATQLTLDNLSHYDASGELVFVELLKNSNLSFQLAGENLARSSEADSGVVRRIEQALMQSPAHRKNILETGFSRVAIGAATDASGHIAFAEIFRSAD